MIMLKSVALTLAEEAETLAQFDTPCDSSLSNEGGELLARCAAELRRIESVLTKAEAVAWEIRGKAGKPWLRCTEEAYQDHVRRVGPEHARALYAHASSAEPAVKYTTGHCKNKAQPGGCQLHNLQCGYPSCDREPIQSPSVPVESLGRDAEPAGGLDAAMRTNGLPAVSDALGYSRNFAAANPHLTQTTKDHITGLCDMLELASAHQTTPSTPPPAKPACAVPLPEVAATVCLTPDGYAHGHMLDLQVQVKPMETFAIGDRLCRYDDAIRYGDARAQSMFEMMLAGRADAVPAWFGELPAPISNPEAWPANYAGGYNDALNMCYDVIRGHAPQPKDAP